MSLKRRCMRIRDIFCFCRLVRRRAVPDSSRGKLDCPANYGLCTAVNIHDSLPLLSGETFPFTFRATSQRRDLPIHIPCHFSTATRFPFTCMLLGSTCESKCFPKYLVVLCPYILERALAGYRSNPGTTQDGNSKACHILRVT